MKLKILTHDEEWTEILKGRIEIELEPKLEALDTVNKQYLITIEIEELPS